MSAKDSTLAGILRFRKSASTMVSISTVSLTTPGVGGGASADFAAWRVSLARPAGEEGLNLARSLHGLKIVGCSMGRPSAHYIFAGRDGRSHLGRSSGSLLSCPVGR